jgi:hypothetical protein
VTVAVRESAAVVWYTRAADEPAATTAEHPRRREDCPPTESVVSSGERAEGGEYAAGAAGVATVTVEHSKSWRSAGELLLKEASQRELA